MRPGAERTPERMESATIPALLLAPPGGRSEAIDRIPGPDPIRTARDPATGLCRIEIDRVGRFHFQPGAPEVRAHPAPGAPPATLRAAYLATVLPLALQAAGHQLLHASAVDTPEGVIAFCGPSGAGKSTLAAALARHGHRQWADDAVWWEIESDEHGEPVRARTRWLPFQRRLRPDAARWLEAGEPRDLTERLESARPEIGRLRAIHLLAPRTGEAHITQSPPPAPLRLIQAFPTLVDNAYHFDAGNLALGALAETYLALAVAVPVIRLVLPDGLDRLEAARPLVSVSFDFDGEGAADLPTMEIR
jgi:hypothetical protein